MHHLDHIIVAIADLDEGIRQVEASTGVRPDVGGYHPTGVTKNALMSLGGQQYLEIIALRDDVETPEDRLWMLEAKQLKPLGWAAFSPDIWETARYLNDHGYGTSELSPGSRALPDGGHLTWTTVSVTKPVIAGAPFFIEWGSERCPGENRRGKSADSTPPGEVQSEETRRRSGSKRSPGKPGAAPQDPGKSRPPTR
jgi:hypothetical protein